MYVVKWESNIIDLLNSSPSALTGDKSSDKPAFLSALDKYFLPDKFNFGLLWC